MKHGIYFISIIVLAFLLAAGCSKKTTKVPETPPVEVEEPEEPAPPVKEPEPEVEKPEPKIDLSFQTVHFDFDKYNVRADQRDELAHNAEVLEAYPNVKLLISGHCDDRGTIEYNLALGEKRANTVKEYLVNYGINESRLSTISYGEQQPVDMRSNEEAWAKNRRAEFKIVQR